jgi:hypothetical protein
MCRQSEALRARTIAAQSLAAACLSFVESPVGEAFDRSLAVNAAVPADMLAILDPISDEKVNS